jgi:hypothetical protein
MLSNFHNFWNSLNSKTQVIPQIGGIPIEVFNKITNYIHLNLRNGTQQFVTSQPQYADMYTRGMETIIRDLDIHGLNKSELTNIIDMYHLRYSILKYIPDFYEHFTDYFGIGYQFDYMGKYKYIYIFKVVSAHRYVPTGFILSNHKDHGDFITDPVDFGSYGKIPSLRDKIYYRMTSGFTSKQISQYLTIDIAKELNHNYNNKSVFDFPIMEQVPHGRYGYGNDFYKDIRGFGLIYSIYEFIVKYLGSRFHITYLPKPDPLDVFHSGISELRLHR